MKKCPYCGEEINSDAKKCRYCGEWLEPKQEEFKSCPYCHGVIPKNAEKCLSCGEWLIDEKTETSVGFGWGNLIVRWISIIWIIIALLVFFIYIDSEFFILVIFMLAVVGGYIGTLIYMFPSIYAMAKQHPQIVPIFVINLLFGETVIGWIAAMVWACTHRIGRHTHW